MTYVRRVGDTRPLRRDPSTRLSVRPATPIRWLPRHGEASCVVEWLSQHLIRLAAYLPAYATLVAMLTLLVVVLKP